MNIKHLALVLGATVTLVGGGMGAVACSSSSSNSSSGSGSGSGSSGGSSGSSSGGTMDSGEDTSSGSSSGGSGSSSGGSDGGGPDCGSIPTLHASPAGTVYCGFNPGDAGGSLECVAEAGTGYCCLGGAVGTGYAPQICAGNAAACVADGDPDAGPSGAGIPIPCNQISDCPANGSPGATACCLKGASAPAMVAGCGYSKAKGGTEVLCEGTGGGAATACQPGEVQLCLADTDCPSPTTCKPGKWKIFQVGFCQ